MDELIPSSGSVRWTSGAPRVVKGKVIIGNGGADILGVRGYVSAYDADTGKLRWRFYTIPGDPNKGPDGAASDAVLKNRAAATWFGKWYEYGGGGTAWDDLVYDAELDQLYIGTGHVELVSGGDLGQISSATKRRSRTACRAAETAAPMSLCRASATRRKVSSVDGSTTSLRPSPAAFTHSPPMNSRSGCLIGGCGLWETLDIAGLLVWRVFAATRA